MIRSQRTFLAFVLLLLVASCRRDTGAAVPRATGYVEATEVRLSAKVPGRAETVNAVEGGRVKPGDVLVTLATTDTDLSINRARAERSQAEAQVRLLRAGARPEDVDQAQAQVAAADADRRAADAELRAAKVDEARFEQLLEKKAGAAKQRDDAVARRELAEARTRAASDRLAVAAAALARVKAGARSEEVDVAEARVKAIDADLDTLNQRRADATIIAGAGGVVTSRLVEPGELVAAGAPVFVVSDLDNAWVNAYVEEPLVPALKIEQQVTVVTDAGNRLPGKISFVAPKAEFTPRNVQTSTERAKLVYRVKVSVDNREGVLKPGMPVEVVFGGEGGK